MNLPLIFNWFCAITLNAIGGSVDIHDSWGIFISQMVILLISFYWLRRLMCKIKSIKTMTFFAIFFIASGYMDLGVPFRHWGVYPIGGTLSAFFGFWFLNPALTLAQEYDELKKKNDEEQEALKAFTDKHGA